MLNKNNLQDKGESMNSEIAGRILDAGREAAYAKMSLDKNMEKPDMRISGFSDLQLLLEHEAVELSNEVFKAIMPGSISEELLNAIRDEAGDVIALASGIAAKCDQELDRIRGGNAPSLFDGE